MKTILIENAFDQIFNGLSFSGISLIDLMR